MLVHDEFLSYAQNAEDFRAFMALGSPARGVYVEVGAHDPVLDSPTFGLYMQGWSGVTIEPNPTFARRHRLIRPRDRFFCLAAWDEDCSLPLTIPKGSVTGWARCGDDLPLQTRSSERENISFQVEAKTLTNILNEADVAEIDLMTIDVEGMARRVLGGLDFSRFSPRLLVIEKAGYSNWDSGDFTDNWNEWEPLISDLYDFAYCDGPNRWYVRRGDAISSEDVSCQISLLSNLVPGGSSVLVPRNPAWSRVEEGLRRSFYSLPTSLRNIFVKRLQGC